MRKRTLDKRKPEEEGVERGRGEEDSGRVESTDDLEASLEEGDVGSRVLERLRDSFESRSDFASRLSFGLSIILISYRFGWRRKRK